MEIHLVRHTQVDVPPGMCYGQADIDLAATRQKEFENIRIANDYDLIISSPLKRCTQLAEHFGLPFRTDKRLMEMNFGDWELQMWNEIASKELQPWFDNYYDVATPNGESFWDVHQRVSAFLLEITTQYPSHKILLVTHLGVIRMMHLLKHNAPISTYFDLKITYGEMIKISF